MQIVNRALSGEADKQQMAEIAYSYRNAAFHLYESIGFRVAHNVLVYRKTYTGN
ncbi:MAG TPA: hypothetical protein VGK81_03875 [Anaerolineae bacterium]